MAARISLQPNACFVGPGVVGIAWQRITHFQKAWMKMSHYLIPSDNYETPSWAIQELIKSLEIKPGEKIWCPFRGRSGNNINTLKKLNLDVAENDSVDFFDYEPKEWDIIIDNPPFSQKENIVRRCIKLNKPFIIILPLLCVRTHWVRDLIRAHDMDFRLAIPSKRINYDLNGKPTFWVTFETAWFCFNCQDRFWGKTDTIFL